MKITLPAGDFGLFITDKIKVLRDPKGFTKPAIPTFLRRNYGRMDQPPLQRHNPACTPLSFEFAQLPN